MLDVTTLDDETRQAMYRQVAAEAWRRGNLRFKLDDTQLKIRDALDKSTTRKFFLLCSRRLGKSFTLITYAFELCVSRPSTRILYLAPTGKDAADIVTDIVDGHLLVDCPENLRPAYDRQNKVYTFKNGSIIRFKGVNGEHAENLRGGASNLIVLDECGSMDDLDYVVGSVCMPMVMTTSGRIILATTPSRSPGHESTAIYEDLAGQDATVKFTLLDNVRIPEEVKAEFLREAGEAEENIPGILERKAPPRTTTALREYWCEFVTDAASSVLPEFTFEAEKEMVKETPRPPYFDAYVAMDPGFKDRTGGLFAYWDFLRGKLVIEDEFLLYQANTTQIADEIKRREWDLWGDREPFQRYSDVDLRLIADLWDRHRIRFHPVQKQGSLEAINLVRNMVLQREIEIHPRCVNLVRQMHNAIWNNKASDFARASEKSPDGHYDLVAALKYLCRSVLKTKNPYPADYRNRLPTGMFRSPRMQARKEAQEVSLLPDTPFARRISRRNRRR